MLKGKSSRRIWSGQDRDEITSWFCFKNRISPFNNPLWFLFSALAKKNRYWQQWREEKTGLFEQLGRRATNITIFLPRYPDNYSVYCRLPTRIFLCTFCRTKSEKRDDRVGEREDGEKRDKRKPQDWDGLEDGSISNQINTVATKELQWSERSAKKVAVQKRKSLYVGWRCTARSDPFLTRWIRTGPVCVRNLT